MEKTSSVFHKGHLHHAYLLEGEAQRILSELTHFIEDELEITMVGNPDVWHGRFQTFAIDDARQLRQAQTNKAFGGDRKIFIIETVALTHEAQNALLKMFEEPTAGSHFFLILPSRWLTLPTVRSRLQVISFTEKEDASKSPLSSSFLEVSPAERLSLIAPLLEEKDKGAALGLVDALIGQLRERQKMPTESIRELLHCRDYLNDRSASVKLILEHLALTLPAFQ